MDEVEGLDEEFLFHLNRGSELLSRGDATGARGALEKALELRARDPKVLGLLGQACYRLGKYEDAIIAWQRLVDESPVEPSARVNLGLAFLKARRQSQAIRQLEIALDLNPDHKKAMGYLGLALFESGDPQRAREWFVRAGSDQMVARCDELLRRAAGEGAAPAEAAPAAPPPAPAGAALDVDVEDAGPPEPEPEPEARAAPAPQAAPQEPPAPAGREGRAPADASAFASAQALAVPAAAPFGVGDEVVAVRVHEAVRARFDGLLAVQGVVESEPEVKRFRGQPTEKPFGVGAARFHLVRGEGLLLFAPGKRRFSALQLADAAFVREEALFALEAELAFENGRVPSPGGEELNLVHLRGQGAVLLATAGAPRALEVRPGVALRLPLEALVGWVGALTPRLVTLVEGGPAEVLGVELTGEGRVLVDPGAARAEEPR